MLEKIGKEIGFVVALLIFISILYHILLRLDLLPGFLTYKITILEVLLLYIIIRLIKGAINGKK